ncbi:hypothetical protein WJX77_002788 [Trebouxia sp. C0004]
MTQEQSGLQTQAALPATESDTGSDSMQTILDLLPNAVKAAILQCLENNQTDIGKDTQMLASSSRRLSAKMLVEVVGDKGRPVFIRFSDNSAEELPVCIDIPDALANGLC